MTGRPRHVHASSSRSSIWNSSDFTKCSEPAQHPDLALFEVTNRADVLVRYNAFSERSSTVKPRAYHLLSNQMRIHANQKPRFVRPSAAKGLKPIPILPASDVVTNLPAEVKACAVSTNEGRGFTLYLPTESGKTFDLPVYVETSGTPTRAILTPFAVVGDTSWLAWWLLSRGW
jgi:hypothetical protein